MNPYKQVYSKYTDEDRLVWQTLFERQMKFFSENASEEFLKSVERINFTKDRIPDFEETNEILGKLNGWRLHEVPNIIPVKEFYEFLAEREFPATTWLRKMNQLDYLEEPDMFHDVFGHVPLLTNKAYSDFFFELSKIAMKHKHNEWAMELLGRMYWFTIEFGLIEENKKLKIYGAGLMSSHGESKFSLGDKPIKIPYSVKKIFDSSFITSKFQTKYFVIDSYETLFNSVNEIEKLLEKEIAVKAEK